MHRPVKFSTPPAGTLFLTFPFSGRWWSWPRSAYPVQVTASVATRSSAITVFPEEEGSRFGVACLGSRLLTGTIDAAKALRLKDGDGNTFADVARANGLDPHYIAAFLWKTRTVFPRGNALRCNRRCHPLHGDAHSVCVRVRWRCLRPCRWGPRFGPHSRIGTGAVTHDGGRIRRKSGRSTENWWQQAAATFVSARPLPTPGHRST